MPLSHFLKQFFAAEKKYGSKDRKQIAALCYNYYRLGKAAHGITIEERIIIATFVCENVHSEFLNFHKPEWNEKIGLPGSEKISISHFPFSIEDIFPWNNELSNGIDAGQFAISFLLQPKLFLRIRPGKTDIVLKKLDAASLSYQSVQEDGISFPNSTRIDEVLEINREVVVQDANSQRVLDHLRTDPPAGAEPIQLWDCCAASGGKSILAYDILKGNVKLAVSDIRESILSNLKSRFKKAGINNYHSFIADLITPGCLPDSYRVPIVICQLLICDAPCTGSGTWSRTPEQLYFFDPTLIDSYAKKQRSIVSNAVKSLQKDGLLFYITCSVFKKENEEIAEFIANELGLEMLEMTILKGYDKRADSMFTAVFQKK